MKRNETLQALCRDYLGKLRYMANKHGLGNWISNVIKANKRGECSATEKEVNALSRLCNDERVTREEVPKILCKSYRECNENEDFDKIKKFKRLGIYSKISTLLYANKIKYKTKVKNVNNT